MRVLRKSNGGLTVNEGEAMSRIKAKGGIVSVKAWARKVLRLAGLVPISEHKWVVAEAEEFRISSDIKQANLDLLQGNCRCQCADHTGELDGRLRAAGMYTVAEMLQGTPLDSIISHAGVHDLESFAQWLEMRRRECLSQQARFALDVRDDHEMYEWVIAHAAVFSEVHINFKAALAPPARHA